MNRFITTSLVLISMTLGFALTGCQNAPTKPDKPFSTASVDEPFLEKGGKPRLGLALSGGGVRSASYTFGVTKRLYDLGILQQVDIVSSVSGGGYSAYQIFTNELNDCKGDRKHFGRCTFEDPYFAENLITHYYTANFVTYGDMVKAAINPTKSLPDMYEEQIARKYGANDQGNYITDLEPYVVNRQMPHWVANTTQIKPKTANKVSSIYEFSPMAAGSLERGYYPYAQNKVPPLRKLAAISGAAVSNVLGYSILEQEIPDPTIASDAVLTLADGGKSENDGAFSLIRRGIENIIIVDAEHDSVYGFEAYRSLKDRLKEWNGADIKIDKIDEILGNGAMRDALSKGGKVDNPVMKGKVIDERGKEISTVYYVKMALSNAAESQYNCEEIRRGEAETVRMETLLRKNSDEKGNWDAKTLQGEIFDYHTMYAYHLDSYPKILAGIKKAQILNNTSDFFSYRFPHITTADQSYFTNQLFAYVSLGYFSAGPVCDALKQDGIECMTHNYSAHSQDEQHQKKAPLISKIESSEDARKMIKESTKMSGAVPHKSGSHFNRNIRFSIVRSHSHCRIPLFKVIS